MGGDRDRSDDADRSPAPAVERPLLDIMVHDLRNPLAALAGNLGLLREELGERELSAIARRCLDDSGALLTRILMMVQSIADAAAIEEGKVVARPGPTRLAPEIEQAVVIARAAVEAREIELIVDVATDLVARVDSRLLGRVIQNLLDNAIRYASHGGRVVVSAAHDGAGLILQIGNSGPALTEDERAQVFERDFRADQRRAAIRIHRDFGLYFCKLVADAHGGSIAVEERPGLPTVFVVRLPG